MGVALEAYLRCSRLMEWFREEFGSEMCQNLTGGVDFRDPEQLSKFFESGHQRCVEMAAKTAFKLQELLE